MKKSLVKIVSIQTGENVRWVPSKHALWLSSNEPCVLSLQMSSGSLTARWQTRPSWQTLVWCPCWTLLLVLTGHILWMRRGLLKVLASVKYTEYTGLSLKNTIFTAEYSLDPFSMLCDHKLTAHCYGMNNYWVFFPQGQHWPFESMDIFVPDKCSQMPSCLSNSIQQHVVFQHTNLSYQLVQHYQAVA